MIRCKKCGNERYFKAKFDGVEIELDFSAKDERVANRGKQIGNPVCSRCESTDIQGVEFPLELIEPVGGKGGKEA